MNKVSFRKLYQFWFILTFCFCTHVHAQQSPESILADWRASQSESEARQKILNFSGRADLYWLKVTSGNFEFSPLYVDADLPQKFLTQDTWILNTLASMLHDHLLSSRREMKLSESVLKVFRYVFHEVTIDKSVSENNGEALMNLVQGLGWGADFEFGYKGDEGGFVFNAISKSERIRRTPLYRFARSTLIASATGASVFALGAKVAGHEHLLAPAGVGAVAVTCAVQLIRWAKAANDRRFFRKIEGMMNLGQKLGPGVKINF